jgi:hypothetical protein
MRLAETSPAVSPKRHLRKLARSSMAKWKAREEHARNERCVMAKARAPQPARPFCLQVVNHIPAP